MSNRAPVRYFTARDAHGGPLPAARLEYVELESWAPSTREATFRAVAAGESEVWVGEVEGFESRPQVSRAAARSALRESSMLMHLRVDEGTGRPYLTNDSVAGDGRLVIDDAGIPHLRAEGPGNRAVVLLPDSTNRILTDGTTEDMRPRGTATFTVILDGRPKVVQIEARDARAGATTAYRLLVTGVGPTQIRHRTATAPGDSAPFARFRVDEGTGRPYLTNDSVAGDGRLVIDDAGIPHLRAEGPGNRAVVLLPDSTNTVIIREVL